MRDVTLASLRRTVSLVQQDVFLFTASIENNIAYGDPWADRERIAQSSEVARLHDYIAGLPKGYETLVGERGVSLSGGQRQRLSIARSILLAPILVFDDSTAAVDAATEQSIREALRTDTATRATIIIAHRLGSLMDADEIVFLERGRIVERGTHAELLALGGRYANLCAAEHRWGAGGRKRRQPGAGAVSITRTTMPSEQPSRPPRAVVGSQINTEEQIFAAFDGRIMRRFWGLSASIGARFGRGSPSSPWPQIAIPLVLRTVIDEALVDGAQMSGCSRSACWSSSGSSFTSLPRSRRRWSRASRSGC